MNAEIQRPRIDLNAIAEAYDYDPLPEGYVPPEKVDLGIDWEKLEPEIADAVNTAVELFDEAKTVCLPDAVHIKAKTLVELEIPAASLCLRIEKRYAEELKIVFLTADGGLVGEFRAQQEGNTWDLVHRMVWAEFEGQGIGANLLKILEQFLAIYGQRKRESQVCTMSVAQLNVLNYFLERGFAVTEKDKVGFENAIAKLENGDNSFCLATDPGDFEHPGMATMQWYIFSATEFKAIEENGWNYDAYMKRSQRFALEKIIEPQVVIQGVRDVSGKVEQATETGM